MDEPFRPGTAEEYQRTATARRERAFRFDCAGPAPLGCPGPSGPHHTGEATPWGTWFEAEPPHIRGQVGRVRGLCMAPHRTMLRVGEQWLPLLYAASPGLTDDVEIGGLLLSAYRRPNGTGPGWLTGRCIDAFCHAPDKQRSTVRGFAVRRTVEDGVQLWHGFAYHGPCGYDVAAFGRPSQRRNAEQAAEPLRLDRNNWAVVDELYACGHRSG